jgi:hypothetical protein
MRNIKPSLKPGGLLVVIEHDSEKSTSTHHRIEQDELFDQLSRAGFEVVRVETFLERDNINIFRRGDLSGARQYQYLPAGAGVRNPLIQFPAPGTDSSDATSWCFGAPSWRTTCSPPAILAGPADASRP